MISHNAEFYEALCPEKWILESGRFVIVVVVVIIIVIVVVTIVFAVVDFTIVFFVLVTRIVLI